MSKTDRVGIYCWAGPDTIRMIQLKFFNPPIDTESLMHSYDYDYIAEVRDKFGITDFWATYSWGFSNESEQEQRKFLLDRVENFKKAGVKLHAYVQGPNLVYSDFKDHNYFAKDQRGRFISYYRGRKVTCINNPEFVDYKLKLITEMCKEDFDGIFMDNMQMGQIPIPVPHGALPYTFAGCNCEYCQKEFKEEYDQNIPVNLEADPLVTKNYLKFRIDSVNKFLGKVYSITSSAKKEFGTNSFDPKFDTKTLLGVNLQDISHYQDYLLFENHSLPDEFHNNQYIGEIADKINKPVFLVSYRNGIGLDQEFTQDDFNNIHTEDLHLKFFACYKGSEYVTDNVWHNLYLNHFKKVTKAKTTPSQSILSGKKLSGSLVNNRILKRTLNRFYNPMFTTYMERKSVRTISSRFSSLILR